MLFLSLFEHEQRFCFVEVFIAKEVVIVLVGHCRGSGFDDAFELLSAAAAVIASLPCACKWKESSLRVCSVGG